MSRSGMANLKKAFYYMKRNGLRDTYLAALERLRSKKGDAYVYEAPDESVLLQQQERSEDISVKFSILVPAYHTKESYLRAMAESVLAQSYGRFELIIADAGAGKELENIIKGYGDDRIRYIPLKENGGISENTNKALMEAKGDYTGLLDHDDLLAPDALYEMASAIRQAEKDGITLQLLYSDEDKCDESGKHYYEPHKKKAFDLDLLLSNNYICHFMVMKTELMKSLCLRKKYDGAQDFDLALRAVGSILGHREGGKRCFSVEEESRIRHIPKVLYHWRCHEDSTAQNPESKQYAYEAGGRAIAAFLKENGLTGRVEATKHLGFYRVNYEGDVLAQRPDIGVIGGTLLGKNKITGGIYEKDKTCPYEGLYKDFSGYMHRASLVQDAYAVDIRLMRVRKELIPLVRSVLHEMGCPDVDFSSDGIPVCDGAFSTEAGYRGAGIKVCREIRSRGYRILWDPGWQKVMKNQR